MSRTCGEFIAISEDEVGSNLELGELFFYGHCKERDLKVGWRDINEYSGDNDLEILRDDYTSIQHVYGRKIPFPAYGKGSWRWMWQRHSGRGAFKISRILLKSKVGEKRLRRRRVRAARRQVLKRFPEAEDMYVITSVEEPFACFYLPGIKWEVKMLIKTGDILISRDDKDMWDKMYRDREQHVQTRYV